MASGNSIMARLGLDTADFRQGLQNSEGFLAKFKNKASSAFSGLQGLLGGAAIAAGLSKVIDKGDQIGDLASQFKVSAEDLQRLGNAGEFSSTSLQAVAKSMGKLRLAQAEAVAGNEELVATFTSIGISTNELAGMPTTELYYKIADAVSSTAGEQEKLTLVSSLFGAKLANELLPMLEQGEAKMREVGGSSAIMSDDMVNSLSQAKDSITRLQNIGTVAFGSLVQYGIMPAIKFVQMLGAGVANMSLDAANNFKSMTQQASNAGSTLIEMGKSILSGDIQGAKDAAARGKKRGIGIEADRLATKTAIDEATQQTVKEIYAPPPSAPAISDPQLEKTAPPRKSSKKFSPEDKEEKREIDFWLKASERAKQDDSKAKEAAARKAEKQARDQEVRNERIADIEARTNDLNLRQAQSLMTLEKEIFDVSTRRNAIVESMVDLEGEDLANAKLKTAELDAQLAILKSQKNEQALIRAKETPQQRSARRKEERAAKREQRKVDHRNKHPDQRKSDNNADKAHGDDFKPDAERKADSERFFNRPKQAGRPREDYEGIKRGELKGGDLKANPVDGSEPGKTPEDQGGKLDEIISLIKTFNMGSA